MNATLREKNLVATTKTLDKSGDRVRDMFAQIAPRYDLLNHVLSLNIDKRWRSKTLKLLDLTPGVPVLDVCTGTGDLALAIARELGPTVEVVGTDFCAPMLDIARTKQAKTLPGFDNLQFIEADTQDLPFPDNHFQCVSVAFGLRNVADTMVGLGEMIRVAQPNGKIAVLEFSKPRMFGLRQLYNAYFLHVLPRIGQAMARNDRSAYEYLPQSVQQFPCGEELVATMRSAGLADVTMLPMTLGVVTLYVGTKRAS
ncbi:MAG: bifunctional demethylmenaquinone methyltransferase/2-methoxy-6-polyprenyl-1,4-benzoquinol methylase UbiE [Pirellula sp.]|jgi:demethylmenaquinone methyltransferase/2-methoxy-6-polyprenyl-1,4-benzoquinol methylase